jgi:hypothetical protein
MLKHAQRRIYLTRLILAQGVRLRTSKEHANRSAKAQATATSALNTVSYATGFKAWPARIGKRMYRSEVCVSRKTLDPFSVWVFMPL